MSLALEQRKVMVLNRNWLPVGIRPLKDALVLLFSTYDDGHPKARIIDAQDYQTFTWEDWSKLRPQAGDDHTITTGMGINLKAPKVILLTRNDRLPYQNHVRFSRRQLFKRDGFRCQYCGCKPGTEELTVDHIVPKAEGGPTSWDNCTTACVQCNSQKANRRPEEAIKGNLSPERQKLWRGPSPMRLLSKPKKPKLGIGPQEKKYYFKDWSHFLSEIYWEVELENDNHDEE